MFIEMDSRTDHISRPRMCQYVHLRLDLTPEEDAHLSRCPGCLRLFKFYLIAESGHINRDKEAVPDPMECGGVAT